MIVALVYVPLWVPLAVLAAALWAGLYVHDRRQRGRLPRR